jgi:PAS domain S-box-containing protein
MKPDDTPGLSRFPFDETDRQAMLARLRDQEDRFAILADTMPQMVWSTLPDGFHDYYNARWYEFTGVPPGSTDGEGWNGMFHPDDQEHAWALWRHSLETGEPYEIEYRLRHASGNYRWVLGRALPMRDSQGSIIRWFGTCTDIHDHKKLLEQREMISHELSHRIKNIFSVIGGLISFTARERPEYKAAAADLRDRVMALGRAHDFVRPHSEASRPAREQTSLHGLIEELLAPYSVPGTENLRISGQDVEIDDRSATPLALILHELATNAAKYGALSMRTGHIDIDIRMDGPDVELRWTETGGPAVTPPSHEGFGTRLIELSAIRQLGGKLEREWLQEGLRVKISIPHSSMNRLSR